jgi:hypothetical protein
VETVLFLSILPQVSGSIMKVFLKTIGDNSFMREITMYEYVSAAFGKIIIWLLEVFQKPFYIALYCTVADL